MTMQNGLFTLDWGSIADAILVAVVTAAVVALVNVVSTSGFDLFTAPWLQIGRNMANLAFIAAVVTLGKDFLSTDSGSFLSITPPNKPSM